jgi:hypothetical protein
MSHVIFLGSSHVNKLCDYINRTNLHDFNIGKYPVVRFYIIRGGKINDVDHCRRWEVEIQNLDPDCVIFHAGSNDLHMPNCSSQLVEEALL